MSRMLAGIPRCQHFVGQPQDRAAIRADRPQPEWLLDDAAVPAVLIAVHAQQSACHTALRGILRAAYSKEMRVEQLGVGKNLLVVFWAKEEDDSLAAIVDRRDGAMQLV